MLIKIIENGLFGLITEKLSLTAESIWFWLLMALAVVLSMAAGYFLGSVNAAIIISTKKYKSDIRNHGSGNAGMTNMFRTFGKAGGFLTLFGDIAKTILPICFGYLFFGYAGAYISGLFVVMGHCFPIYYRFKGGKGVLAAATMILLLNDARLRSSCFCAYAYCFCDYCNRHTFCFDGIGNDRNIYPPLYRSLVHHYVR